MSSFEETSTEGENIAEKSSFSEVTSKTEDAPKSRYMPPHLRRKLEQEKLIAEHQRLNSDSSSIPCSEEELARLNKQAEEKVKLLLDEEEAAYAKQVQDQSSGSGNSASNSSPNTDNAAQANKKDNIKLYRCFFLIYFKFYDDFTQNYNFKNHLIFF